MTVRPSRLLGLAFAAAILIVAGVYWRSSAARRVLPGSETPHRGGQIVASIHADPRSFNRLVARDLPSEIVSRLIHGRLVRVNPVTFEVEPWLAERWETSAEGRTITLHLRRNVRWSDGVPFTSADVLFTFEALFDPNAHSLLASVLTVGGRPIRASAPDASTVVLQLAAPSGPGVRLLDNLPILPKHALENALKAGTFATAWDTKTSPGAIVSTGPFTLREYRPGERLVFDRNPRYWRTAADGTSLPYLDRVVIEIVPEQNAELVQLQSGALDLTQDTLRPEDYVAAKRGERDGRLAVVDVGVATDADAFWFCLKPEAKQRDPRFAFVQKREFRQAISRAVDRQEFADTVFLGEAVPVWGPVTPGNRRWFSPNVPQYPYDLDKAHALLRSIGLEDRNGNGVVEDEKGTEARFTVITQRGIGSYEKGATLLREQAAKIGIALDIVPLEFGAMIQRMLASDYDAIYMRVLASDLDPAGNLDMWLSSGSAHFWNLEEKTPATDWERRIDTLMLQQAAATDERQRHDLFDQVQRIFAENLPVLYFAAPRLFAATSVRLHGAKPSVLKPTILWNADTLAVSGPPPAK